ncbi:MAG: integrase [Desulfocapsa sp.]|nr:MAG: integrase [Desulfocapsa sp.]
MLGEVAAGRDPAEDRDKARISKTMGDLLDQFIDEHVVAKLKKNTIGAHKSSINLHVPQKLKNRFIIEISRRDMSNLHNKMQDTPSQANRTIAMLSKFFNWCEQNGHRDNGSNPCRHIKRYKEHKRERFLSPEELSRLSRALKDAEKEQTATPWSIAAIRLLIFTGARLNEILTLKWEYVDFDLKQIRLPDSKTGRKSIYLNDPALDLLAGVPRTEGNPFVICGARKGRNLVNLQKPWRRIRSAAGLDDVRLHDLRHTFASFGAIGGISLPIIGGLVGHSQPGTTARYAHLSNDPLMAASNAIGSEIAKAMRQDGK